MRSFLCRGLLVLLAALPLFASAQTAHQVVQQTTDQMLAGAVTLTGDVIVPAGVTLTVAAGTTVTAAGTYSLSV